MSDFENNKENNIKALSVKDEIKTKLIDTDFEQWDKYNIIFLVSIFQYKQYEDLYEGNLNLLKRYIDWARNNQDKVVGKNMYSYDTLVQVYHIINDDLFYDKKMDYKIDLESIESKYSYKNKYYAGNKDCGLYLYDTWFIFFGIFLIVFLIVFSMISFIKNMLLSIYKKTIMNKVYDVPLNIPIYKKTLNSSLNVNPLENFSCLHPFLNNLSKSSFIDKLFDKFVKNKKNENELDSGNNNENNINNENINNENIDDLFKNNDLMQNIMKLLSTSI